MKNGKVINILEFVWVVVGGGWWWIPLHYLVTSEIDFRLSEAVTMASILDVAKVCLLTPVPELGKKRIR